MAENETPFGEIDPSVFPVPGLRELAASGCALVSAMPPFTDRYQIVLPGVDSATAIPEVIAAGYRRIDQEIRPDAFFSGPDGDFISVVPFAAILDGGFPGMEPFITAFGDVGVVVERVKA
ncbi:MAG: hypothetical protein J7484_15100 [Microbacterium sp.]|nr:hypothetical protein [Microbacterium sp.]